MTRHAASLPEGPLVAFYGDDFTGSSAVMEVLTFAGLKTVMFVAPPTPAELERFAGYRAIGIASIARAQSPDWMDANLPLSFEALDGLGAPINHYKICSTLDSSPTVGSVGRAVDIGTPIFARRSGAAEWQPLLVAAPPIHRYQAFGNLFAQHAGIGHRLDRHPVMRNHPSTPMREADVRLHLAAQTRREMGLIDFAAMKDGSGLHRFTSEVAAGRAFVALDVVDDETLEWTGRLMWEQRGEGLFAVGSQGVEYALVAYWQAEGLLPQAPAVSPARPMDGILAVSGSVSATTADQINWAEGNGFDIIALEPALAVQPHAWALELDRVTDHAARVIGRGRSPLVTTARGPDDAAVGRMRGALVSAGLEPSAINGTIGAGLGEIAGRLLRQSGLRRLLVCGGDTSGFAAAALGIFALEATAPLAPGAPLCRAYSTLPHIDGIEVALKGGQMGNRDYFGAVRAGRVQ